MFSQWSVYRKELWLKCIFAPTGSVAAGSDIVVTDTRFMAVRLTREVISKGALPLTRLGNTRLCLPKPGQWVRACITYARNLPAKPPPRLCPCQHLRADAGCPT